MGNDDRADAGAHRLGVRGMEEDVSRSKLRSVSASQLAEILSEHRKWLAGDGGTRADLHGSDLRESNLRYSDLSLSDLRGSDLRGSDLSGSTGLLDASQWIAENLTRCRGGVYAYKSFGIHYESPADWRQEPGAEISETVNLLPTIDCACGVNVATLDWVRNNSNDAPIWKVLVRWEWMAGGVIPYNTEGKFRVPRAKLIEIVVPGEETS